MLTKAVWNNEGREGTLHDPFKMICYESNTEILNVICIQSPAELRSEKKSDLVENKIRKARAIIWWAASDAWIFDISSSEEEI